MSRFFSEKYAKLTPYVPGEQPEVLTDFVKLNTNENPFPPSEKAVAYAAAHTRSWNYYPDPDCIELRTKLAEVYGVDRDEVILGNGSDEVLNFAFMAFCDKDHPAVFPTLSYSFYPVFASVNCIPYEKIPLKEDYTIAPEDFFGLNRTMFIPNPNAPTGILLSVNEIESIVAANPDSVVVIDEAYIDFGGESCIPLIRKYENLLVVQTFSKSRSMAGARLGFGIGCRALIDDLNTVRNSMNPYNINSFTQAAALGTLADPEYTRGNCAVIMKNREYTTQKLRERGFFVIPSMANFVFASSPDIDGGELCEKLKERGVLVRHFNQPEISRFNRIAIGTREQMDVFISTVDDILGGIKK